MHEVIWKMHYVVYEALHCANTVKDILLIGGFYACNASFSALVAETSGCLFYTYDG